MEDLKYLFTTKTKNKLNEIEENFYIEEYKIFTNAIFETDKKIIQLFSFTILSSITLITWIGAIIFNKETLMSLQLAYASLIPNMFIFPSFIYLIAQRIDLVWFAAYVHLIETRLGVYGFQTGMHPDLCLRSNILREGESNDPVPYAFFTVITLSIGLFYFALDKAKCENFHLAIGVFIEFVFLYLVQKWNNVISDNLLPMINAWKSWDVDRNLSDRRLG